MSYLRSLVHSARTITSDIAQGFLEITHNSFAILGFITASITIVFFAQPELRGQAEAQLRIWLQDRQVADLGFAPVPEAIERTTATNPQELPNEQSAVAYWISKKYRVAAEPIAAIVAEAYQIGEQQNIDPTLLLAVMAVESSFNPFAQSSVGAQGLMQVMTRVHTEKYENFGGNLAAFDPISNLRVGANILKGYIRTTGSIEGGLRYYVGAANLPSDGGYAAKVLAEYNRLRQVADATALTPTPHYKPQIVAKRRIAAPAEQEQEQEQVTESTQSLPTSQAEEQLAALEPQT